MKRIASITTCALALAVAGTLAAAPALAERPGWAGNDQRMNRDQDRRMNQERQTQRDYRTEREVVRERSRNTGQTRARVKIGGHFDDRNRVIVRDYYHEHYRSGRCPPGLHRKNNGCMPPGQVRSWHLGRVLPRGVIFYDVPPALIVQLGHPPAGYRYVRVASDILMIAIGTGLVVDAIQDLGGMQ